MPPIPKAMGVGDAIVTYQVSKAGGAFWASSRSPTRAPKRPVVSPSSPPAAQRGRSRKGNLC